MIRYVEARIVLHNLNGRTVEDVCAAITAALRPLVGDRFDDDVHVDVVEYAGVDE